MTVEELLKLPKIDSHTHLMGLAESEEEPLLGMLEELNFKWLDICTPGLQEVTLSDQVKIAERVHALYPERISWAISFELTGWGEPDWESRAVEKLKNGFDKGAVAVKVWKGIGFDLKDRDGGYVMIDDPRFDPIYDYIVSRSKACVGHIGEPLNCWLPLEEMTVLSDRKYFSEHPEYHCYFHPEVPHHSKHIQARDNVLAKHPGLRFVGAHLASLEFDVAELARRLDRYPNLAVDLAERICHFQVQDHGKVREFCIEYQDRILYGTDLGAGRDYTESDIDSAIAKIKEIYSMDFRYFAADDEMEAWQVKGKFRGLALPDGVLKKIFHDNAVKWYLGI
ncbi:MAG: amidohydrolase family protein [Gemmatimonadota bacterium]|nr:amidohydrolase family protein [Gemmatimonadota bacterium]